MTDLTDYDDPTPDLTRTERDLLRLAGASEELILMCTVFLPDVPPRRGQGRKPARNSVMEETKKYLRGTDFVSAPLTEDSTDEFEPYGGHFYQAMWDGDLYRAFSRADRNNSAIMLHVFSVYEINQDKPQNASPVVV